MKTRIPFAAAILATCVIAFAQSVTVITIPTQTATSINIPVQVTTNDQTRARSIVVTAERGPGTNNTSTAYIQFSGGGTNTVPGIPLGVWPNETVTLQFGAAGYAVSNIWIRFGDTNDGAMIFVLP